MNLQEYIKTLPERRQRRIKRGSRLFNYIIEKRCEHREMHGKPASPKARGVAGK
ncbi:MAG: hypothetical protein MJE68_12880 [Proteobacteria bacterium]|nr:hypothetical protein [Pseudomonadota bacterium]